MEHSEKDLRAANRRIGTHKRDGLERLEKGLRALTTTAFCGGLSLGTDGISGRIEIREGWDFGTVRISGRLQFRDGYNFGTDGISGRIGALRRLRKIDG